MKSTFTLKLNISLCGVGKRQKTNKIGCLKPNTVHNFRQDAAYFYQDYEFNKNHVLVNDGVGGWDDRGVDSRFYSGNLTSFLSAEISLTKKSRGVVFIRTFSKKSSWIKFVL